MECFITAKSYFHFIIKRNLHDTLAKCRHAYETRDRGLAVNEMAKNKFLSTLTDEQRRLASGGQFVVIGPMMYLDMLISTLQNTIVEIANDVGRKQKALTF